MSSRIISNDNIANAALYIKLTQYINLGPNFRRNQISTKLLASCLEAVVGAIQRDNGQSIKCQRLIQTICNQLIIQTALRTGMLHHDNDYKTQLQEFLRTKNPSVVINYCSVKSEVIDKQIYHTECLYIDNRKVLSWRARKKNRCHQLIARQYLVKKKVITIPREFDLTDDK